MFLKHFSLFPTASTSTMGISLQWRTFYSRIVIGFILDVSYFGDKDRLIDGRLGQSLLFSTTIIK